MKEKEIISPISILLLRITVCGIFINAGISHLIYTDKTAARLKDSFAAEFLQYFTSLEMHIVLSGYAMLIFGIALLLGVYTKWSALLLFIILIPITLAMQTTIGLLHGPFWKNVAIAGSLLFFIINNPNAFTLTFSKNKSK